jgi:hypothetical protein
MRQSRSVTFQVFTADLPFDALTDYQVRRVFRWILGRRKRRHRKANRARV